MLENEAQKVSLIWLNKHVKSEKNEYVMNVGHSISPGFTELSWTRLELPSLETMTQTQPFAPWLGLGPDFESKLET